MSKVHRSFSLEFKRAALARMAAGELVSALAVEFDVHRQLIYEWRDAERDGSMGRRRGRPSKLEALAREAGLAEANELAVARRKVADLERKVGQQAVEIDFFRGALRRIEASRQAKALDMALIHRRPPPGELLHHSDRGVQYACADYTRALEAAGVIASMSRGGCPYDNAKAGSFMKTLKTEEVDGSACRDLTHARARISEFIENVYNRTRLHSALKY